jgi:hypothetical protein
MQAIKYWQRKPSKSKGRAVSVGQTPKRSGIHLKPLPDKPPINKDIITCDKLFRQFKNTGKLDDPEASAPWPDLV